MFYEKEKRYQFLKIDGNTTLLEQLLCRLWDILYRFLQMSNAFSTKPPIRLAEAAIIWNPLSKISNVLLRSGSLTWKNLHLRMYYIFRKRFKNFRTEFKMFDEFGAPIREFLIGVIAEPQHGFRNNVDTFGWEVKQFYIQEIRLKCEYVILRSNSSPRN